MPSSIGKCKLIRIKHITLLEGETFLRNKHEIAFFEIKCTFFGRKENTISVTDLYMKIINNKHTLLYNHPTIHVIQRYNVLCEFTNYIILFKIVSNLNINYLF